MARGRPRKNPTDVLIKSAELIGWALGGIEREIVETRHRLSSLTAQANQLRKRAGVKSGRPAAAASAASAEVEETAAPAGRKRRRRTMSPEARKRMSEMMKKRWAERRKKA
ncbi:MAG TPA: hypothetical protein VKH34_05900 [Vicinamibacterales bacterium]|nr:hypothetical protein [Vicinamibacterales bacterium]